MPRESAGLYAFLTLKIFSHTLLGVLAFINRGMLQNLL